MIRIAISFPINHALMRGGVTLAVPSCSLLAYLRVSLSHPQPPPASGSKELLQVRSLISL
jgi:hypothetical protein